MADDNSAHFYKSFRHERGGARRKLRTVVQLLRRSEERLLREREKYLELVESGTFGAPLTAVEDAAVADELERERAARRMHEAASLAKDRLIATISHDLRGPLNAMLGWTRILRHQNLADVERQRALESLERSVRMQDALVQDLVDFSRVACGKLPVNLVPLDLGRTARAVIVAHQPHATEQGIRLSVETPTEPVIVSGDRTRLEQVLTNLVMNALKFTPCGGRVEVSVVRTDDGVASLEVRDTGKGISPDALENIFDSYHQESGREWRQGLGLGLTIARELVHLHGGNISARSGGPGKGASFEVCLPIVTSDPEPSKTALLDNLGPRLEDLVVLVIAVDSDTCEIVRTVIGGLSARVCVARHAAVATAMFDDECPDVVIIESPTLDDAAGLLRALRTKEPTVPIVALSARADRDDIASYLALGFDAHIAKPVSIDDLVAGVRTAARSRARY